MWTYQVKVTNTGQVYTVTVAYDPATYAAMLPAGWQIISSAPATDPATTDPPTTGGSVIYRLMLDNATRTDPVPGATVGIETGATYPGCSRTTPSLCQPLHFETLEGALVYAAAHGEVPVMVHSEEEAWQIVEGTRTIDPSQIITTAAGSWVTWAVAAGVAYFLFFHKRKAS